ncbi:MAG: SIR2 family protein, partial [Promethearchaeota archaeon]
MTTNFDFLIEGALSKLNIPYKEIIPVITEEDFMIYSNPTELLERGYKAIYKIHGTPKNVITGEDTRDSVIKTIKAEPFKRELLDNICEGRSLVIMGYSGVNDSDIIPTLRVLKNLKKIIWINHSESIQPGYEKIYEIASGKSQISKNIDKHLISTAKNLQEIRLMSNASKIYLTSLNTSKMVKDLIQIKPKLKLDMNSISIVDWFKENIKIPNVFEKISIAARIYYEFGFLNEAMKCSEIMNRFTTLADVKSWKLMAQEAITKSYLYQLKNPEALNRQTKGDTIGYQKNILTMRAYFLDITAKIHHSMGNYSEALKRLEETLDVNEKLDNPRGIATGLKSI